MKDYPFFIYEKIKGIILQTNIKFSITRTNKQMTFSKVDLNMQANQHTYVKQPVEI